ncbi:MAG: zinc transporter ZupT [Methanobacteriota archaeon]|nr:MAG: zinc transporter ZupT [Euryarchaeota archaeon]
MYLGLVPLPLFKRLSAGWRAGLVSFSAGVLLFLFADVTHEGVELSAAPGSSPFLFAIGIVLGLLGPVLVSGWARNRRAAGIAQRPGAGDGGARLFTAYMIALGIGLHNLGEGLAIGAAYAAGTFGLTTLLVIGFFLHNSTEGLGIAGPIATVPTHWREPLLLGFLAGAPTILGSMIGSLAFSATLGALFFAAAAGALLYVVVELAKMLHASDRISVTFAGIVGLLTMYFTGLLIR